MIDSTFAIKKIEDYDHEASSTSYDCPYETAHPSLDDEFFGWEHYIPHKNYIKREDYDDLSDYEDEPYAYGTEEEW